MFLPGVHFSISTHTHHAGRRHVRPAIESATIRPSISTMYTASALSAPVRYHPSPAPRHATTCAFLVPSITRAYHARFARRARALLPARASPAPTAKPETPNAPDANGDGVGVDGVAAAAPGPPKVGAAAAAPKPGVAVAAAAPKAGAPLAAPAPNVGVGAAPPKVGVGAALPLVAAAPNVPPLAAGPPKVGVGAALPPPKVGVGAALPLPALAPKAGGAARRRRQRQSWVCRQNYRMRCHR